MRTVNFLLTTAAFYFALTAHAQISMVIPYQGTMADLQGEPMNGTYDMRFRLLDLASVEQWNSGVQSVELTNGAYSVVLGQSPQPPLPADLIATHDQLDLEISFDDGTHGMETLLPLVRILPVPYALRAASADAVGPLTEIILPDPVIPGSQAEFKMDQGILGIGVTRPPHINNLLIDPDFDLLRFDGGAQVDALVIPSPTGSDTGRVFWLADTWHIGTGPGSSTGVMLKPLLQEVHLEAPGGVVLPNPFDLNDRMTFGWDTGVFTSEATDGTNTIGLEFDPTAMEARLNEAIRVLQQSGNLSAEQHLDALNDVMEQIYVNNLVVLPAPTQTISPGNQQVDWNNVLLQCQKSPAGMEFARQLDEAIRVLEEHVRDAAAGDEMTETTRPLLDEKGFDLDGDGDDEATLDHESGETDFEIRNDDGFIRTGTIATGGEIRAGQFGSGEELVTRYYPDDNGFCLEDPNNNGARRIWIADDQLKLFQDGFETGATTRWNEITIPDDKLKLIDAENDGVPELRLEELSHEETELEIRSDDNFVRTGTIATGGEIRAGQFSTGDESIVRILPGDNIFELTDQAGTNGRRLFDLPGAPIELFEDKFESGSGSSWNETTDPDNKSKSFDADGDGTHEAQLVELTDDETDFEIRSDDQFIRTGTIATGGVIRAGQFSTGDETRVQFTPQGEVSFELNGEGEFIMKTEGELSEDGPFMVSDPGGNTRLEVGVDRTNEEAIIRSIGTVNMPTVRLIPALNEVRVNNPFAINDEAGCGDCITRFEWDLGEFIQTTDDGTNPPVVTWIDPPNTSTIFEGQTVRVRAVAVDDVGLTRTGTVSWDIANTLQLRATDGGLSSPTVGLLPGATPVISLRVYDTEQPVRILAGSELETPRLRIVEDAAPTVSFSALHQGSGRFDLSLTDGTNTPRVSLHTQPSGPFILDRGIYVSQDLQVEDDIRSGDRITAFEWALDNGSATTTLRQPAGQVTPLTLMLPGSDGASGQVLTTNGAGTLTFSTPTATPSGTAGGDLSGTYPNPTIATGAVTSLKILDATITAADLATDAVTGAKILDATITSADIASNTIASSNVLDGTIAAADLGTGAVTSVKILDATILAADLAVDAVVSAAILDGTISSADLAVSSVTTSKILDDGVTSAKILDGTIVAGDIGGDAVTSSKILDGAVSSADIADNSVSSADILDATVAAADLAGNSVSSSHIVDATITSADIANDAVTGNQLSSSGVTAGSYGSATQAAVITVDLDGRITSASSAAITVTPSGAAGGDLTGTYPNPAIAADAVTGAKVLDATITSADIQNATIAAADLGASSVTGGAGGALQDNTVTTDDIADATLTAADLATSSVTSDEIADNTIVSADILNGALSAADMGASSVVGGSGGTIQDNSVSTEDILNGTIQAVDLAGGVGADNLGNHTATSALNLATNNLTNAGSIGSSSLTVSGATSVGSLTVSGLGTMSGGLNMGGSNISGANLCTVEDLYLSAVNSTILRRSNLQSSAWIFTVPVNSGTVGQALFTDGTGVTSWGNIPGDNLGSHTATTTLNLATNNLTNAGSIGSSSLTVSGVTSLGSLSVSGLGTMSGGLSLGGSSLTNGLDATFTGTTALTGASFAPGAVTFSGQPVDFAATDVDFLAGAYPANTLVLKVHDGASNKLTVDKEGDLTVASLTVGSGGILSTGGISGGTITATGSVDFTGGTFNKSGGLTTLSGGLSLGGTSLTNGLNGTFTGALSASSLTTSSGCTLTGVNLNGGSLTNGNISLGSGTYTSTGTLSVGAASASSLDAGSGTIQTTGGMNGGSITITNAGAIGGILTLSQGGSGTIFRTSQMTGGNHVLTTTNGGSSISTTTNPTSGTESTSGMGGRVFISSGSMVFNTGLNDGARQGSIVVTDQLSASSCQLIFSPNSNSISTPGMFNKGGGTFKIDHPLDPYNKYLYHSFVESPDMMNIYNGNVITNDSGTAVVVMPDYFEVLNRDFRYQLTVIGDFAQAIVARKMADGKFVIRTDKPNIEVSWQVTGVRQDTFAEENRVVVEVEKEDATKGTLLYTPKATAHNQN